MAREVNKNDDEPGEIGPLHADSIAMSGTREPFPVGPVSVSSHSLNPAQDGNARAVEIVLHRHPFRLNAQSSGEVLVSVHGATVRALLSP